ncbi:unnamed protein product, partial [Laminaria digitata]
GGGDGDGVSGDVVEVGLVEFNASQECAGDDAWACLARRVGGSLAYAGFSSGGSDGSGNLEQRPEVEKVEGLERTLLRLVKELHDDYQPRATDYFVTYICSEGHTLTLAAGDNPRRGGCSRPRVIKDNGGGGGGSAGVGVDGGVKGGVNG